MSDGIVVVTSCTATKFEAPPNGKPGGLRTAESLYAGQQHLRLMRGVRAYRRAGSPAGPLKLRILSAGHGLLASRATVTSYDATFQGLPREVIRARAADLDVPAKLGRLLRSPYRLALLLLGDDYLEAAGLDAVAAWGGPALALCGPRSGLRLKAIDELAVTTLSNSEARRFGCGLVSLKGELGGRALQSLAGTPDSLDELSDPQLNLLDWMDEAPPTADRAPGLRAQASN